MWQTLGLRVNVWTEGVSVLVQTQQTRSSQGRVRVSAALVLPDQSQELNCGSPTK